MEQGYYWLKKYCTSCNIASSMVYSKGKLLEKMECKFYFSDCLKTKKNSSWSIEAGTAQPLKSFWQYHIPSHKKTATTNNNGMLPLLPKCFQFFVFYHKSSVIWLESWVIWKKTTIHQIKGHVCSLFPTGPADKLHMWINGKQKVRGVAAAVSAQIFGFHGTCSVQIRWFSKDLRYRCHPAVRVSQRASRLRRCNTRGCYKWCKKRSSWECHHSRLLSEFESSKPKRDEFSWWEESFVFVMTPTL